MRAWVHFASKYKDAGRSEDCSWIYEAAWQQPARAGGLCGDQEPHLPSLRFSSQPGPRMQRESEASLYKTAPSDHAWVSGIIDGVFTTSQRPVPG